MASAKISVKGKTCTIDQAERLLSFHTSTIKDVEVIIDEILQQNLEEHRFDLRVRVAALGRRIDGGEPDGVIMDCHLVFHLEGQSWPLRVLEVNCPPKWAQWNSRPNGLAPIHYGDPFWWNGRTERSHANVPEV